MRPFIFILFIAFTLSCKKNNAPDEKQIDPPRECGTILQTPVLDSFFYPTYYITATVQFADAKEVVHLKGNVTGAHDGSWFLSKYDKDTVFCRNLVP